MSLPGLVDGVGEDLKDRVLTALQAVGAENDPRTLPHPVGPLQRGDGLIPVIRFFWCHKFAASLFYRIL